MKEIRLPVGDIAIFLDDANSDGTYSSGSISSSLKDDADDATEYNAAIDGIESLILALACAGVDVQSEAFIAGLTSAEQAIGNNF